MKSLFPNARDYTDVYDHYGLLGDRSLFGHGIHLSERECARLSEIRLDGRALPDLQHISRLGPDEHAASCVSPSGRCARRRDGYRRRHESTRCWRRMGEAYKVQMLNGLQAAGRASFSIMATRGNAERSHLDDQIGSDRSRQMGRSRRARSRAPRRCLPAAMNLSQSLEDVLFSLPILGDDRAVPPPMLPPLPTPCAGEGESSMTALSA